MNNNDILIVLFLGTFIMTSFAIVIAILVVIHKRRQMKDKLERQRLAFTYENELLQTRLNEQEQAMQIISGEIHDNLAQVLGHSKMYLNRLEPFLPEGEAKSHYERLAILLKQAVNDMRSISHGLNSELLEQMGLCRSVEREIAYLEESTSLNCSFEVNGSPVHLRKEHNLLAFRIIQEALQNTVKHAKATSLNVTFQYAPQSLEIEIRDDGIGFVTGIGTDYESLGLRNMFNRARLMQAWLNIHSFPGAGTTLNLRIPIAS